MTITREQAEKISRAVDDISKSTPHELLAAIVDALGGVEKRIIDGWTEQVDGSWAHCDGDLTAIRGRQSYDSVLLTQTSQPGNVRHYGLPLAVVDAIAPRPLPTVSRDDILAAVRPVIRGPRPPFTASVSDSITDAVMGALRKAGVAK